MRCASARPRAAGLAPPSPSLLQAGAAPGPGRLCPLPRPGKLSPERRRASPAPGPRRARRGGRTRGRDADSRSRTRPRRAPGLSRGDVPAKQNHRPPRPSWGSARRGASASWRGRWDRGRPRSAGTDARPESRAPRGKGAGRTERERRGPRGRQRGGDPGPSRRPARPRGDPRLGAGRLHPGGSSVHPPAPAPQLTPASREARARAPHPRGRGAPPSLARGTGRARLCLEPQARDPLAHLPPRSPPQPCAGHPSPLLPESRALWAQGRRTGKLKTQPGDPEGDRGAQAPDPGGRRGAEAAGDRGRRAASALGPGGGARGAEAPLRPRGSQRPPWRRSGRGCSGCGSPGGRPDRWGEGPAVKAPWIEGNV